jgi:hypothetical protein
VVECRACSGKSMRAKVLTERLHAQRIFDWDDNPFLAAF